MTRVVESAFVPHAVEDVFRDAADPEEQRRWDRGSLRSLERISAQPLGPGARYRADFRWIGPVEFEIVEFEPPRRYVHLTKIPFGEMRHTFTFDPEAGGTSVRQEADLRLGPLGGLLAPAIAWMLRRRMRRLAAEVARDLGERSASPRSDALPGA